MDTPRLIRLVAALMRATPAAVILLGPNGCQRESARTQIDNSTSRSIDSSTASAGTALATPDSLDASAEPVDTTWMEGFSCSPNVLTASDTLTVQMKTPHPGYLMADHPDGTNFFLVYPSYGEPTLKYSIVPSEKFKNTSVLRIPADIKANPRVLGRENGVEPLFTRPGTYVITLGELEGLAATCKIRYVGKR